MTSPPETIADASVAATTVASSVEMQRAISASLLRVRLRSPFFATIALHARFIESTEVPTAATDGSDVYVNPEFVSALSSEHLDGVLLHEVLHAALGHVHRRGMRDPRAWNIAADIVVNGLILDNGFSLPEGALIDAALQNYSTEEVFALLQRPDAASRLDQLEIDIDLMESGAPGQGGRERKDGKGTPDGPPRPGAAAMSDRARVTVEQHWKAATARAHAVARGRVHGHLPQGVERAFGLNDSPTLDWRSLLWRFLAPSATDFATFDRRYVHRGLYLETLEDQNLRIAIAVDTSGSIDDQAVSALMAEVNGVLGTYPGIECWLYYADAEVHGPWKITPGGELPEAVGGGGTDFRPFFNAIADLEREHGAAPAVCVYLTDGYGDFPEVPPEVPVLWAVVPGGLDDEAFPFGEVARIV